MIVEQAVLDKWSGLIDCAKRYWIDSLPTGISDGDFDELERKAIIEDKFYVRDYVLETYLKGTRTQNKYIEKITKFKVVGKSMLQGMIDSAKELSIPAEELYCDLKYDGSSIAIYLNPEKGTVERIVTVGNLNLDGYGIDQTWKLINHVPKKFPLGIAAIQCEALIDLTRYSGDVERARQKANGLINSKYCDSDVNNLLTLRAYRYYLAKTQDGYTLSTRGYRGVIESLPTVKSPCDGHILFSPAQVWTLADLIAKGGDFTETDRVVTNTGTFLCDGWVLYNKAGICQRALKFSGAGSGTEAIKTTVKSILWNDQSPKGKDSWSANVIIDPVTIKGCTITKPSAGSVSKLIKGNCTPGASVGIILANSTIPMVGEIFSPGDGNYSWPTCGCGYKLGPGDIYGSLLKCGNPECTERLSRMRQYLSGISNFEDIDLNKLLVLDRFKWENVNVSLDKLLGIVKADKIDDYHAYLESFLTTDLQKRNLNLVYKTSFKALKEKW